MSGSEREGTALSREKRATLVYLAERMLAAVSDSEKNGGVVREQAADIIRLCARVEELQQDADRLDRLERFCRKYPHGVAVDVCAPEYRGDTAHWRLSGYEPSEDGDTNREEYRGSSLRAAIDAAIAHTPDPASHVR